MTKDELIALAKEGKAHIEAAFTITRYCVSRAPLRPTANPGYPAIFISINNEDGSVYGDDTYFSSDAIDEIELSDGEAETIREAIERSGSRP